MTYAYVREKRPFVLALIQRAIKDKTPTQRVMGCLRGALEIFSGLINNKSQEWP